MWQSGKGMLSRPRSVLLLALALCLLLFYPAVTMAQSTPSDGSSLNQRISALSAILTQLEQSGMELQTLSDEQGRQITSYRQRLTELQSELESSRQHSSELEQQIAGLEKSVETLRQQLVAARTSYDQLQATSARQIHDISGERDRQSARADAALFIVRLGPVIAGVVGFVAGLLIGLNVQ